MISGVCLVVFVRSTELRQEIRWLRHHSLYLRSVALLIAWLCYFNAARDLPLGDLTTIYFSAPIIVAVLAVPLLKERLTAWRSVSLVVGFIGVAIACQPSGLSNGVAVGLAMAAACLWAIAAILMRQVAIHVKAITLMISSNTLFMLICGIAAPFSWRTPTLADAGLMIGVAAVSYVAQIAAINAAQRAPAAVTSSLEFSALIWAFGLGYAIWGDVPTTSVMLGATLIIGGTVLLMWKER